MRILGIDPGTLHSAAVLFDSEQQVVLSKVDLPNQEMLWHVYESPAELVAIEMISNLGQTVGMDVFWTLRWLGRFEQIAAGRGIPVWLITRLQIKAQICGQSSVKDKNVRQGLINRFGEWTHGNTGLGNKAHPGKLYGFKDHMFSALAVCVTAAEAPLRRERELTEELAAERRETKQRKKEAKALRVREGVTSALRKHAGRQGDDDVT